MLEMIFNVELSSFVLVVISVTRVGNYFTTYVGKILKVFGNFLRVWQNFESTLANEFMLFGNFSWF